MRIVIAALLLMPAAALASSTFDGTWKGRIDSLKVTGKPNTFGIADGMYTCSSCNPEIKVKADGTDQPVTGHAYYDTVAVKAVDSKTIERTYKQKGKLALKNTVTVSADGSKLTSRTTDYTAAKPADFALTFMRVSAAPPGAHATSGSWQTETLNNANDAAIVVAYEMTPEHFIMRANGQSYDAKFDGKEYPVTGDPGHTSVTLRKIDENTVEEIDHRMGKVTDEIRLAAAPDGKTIHVTDKDIQNGQTVTYTLDKQQ
jgi:hypothetical protein